MFATDLSTELGYFLADGDLASGSQQAAELVGRGGWINTGGESYSLTDFRGRFVLPDFWAFWNARSL